MLAPSPRAPGIEYRTAYGFTMFDCTSLRATIQPAACADNFTQRRCLACKDCSVGSVHSGKATQAPTDRFNNIALTCVRCGQRATRLVIGKTLCVSCFNRQNEVIRGANGKRQFPAIVATRLHKTFAILTGNALMQTFYFAPIIRRDALPRLTQISPGAYWLETIVASENELRAFVDRRIPSAEIDNFELMPDFSRSRDNTMEASGNP